MTYHAQPRQANEMETEESVTMPEKRAGRCERGVPEGSSERDLGGVESEQGGGCTGASLVKHFYLLKIKKKLKIKNYRIRKKN